MTTRTCDGSRIAEAAPAYGTATIDSVVIGGEGHTLLLPVVGLAEADLGGSGWRDLAVGTLVEADEIPEEMGRIGYSSIVP